MAHPRNRGDSSIRLIGEGKGAKEGGDAKWPPTFHRPDLSFPSMPKFGGQKPANGTMTQPFFVGREVAAMLPDKIDSLK